jgi:MSHA biogenesis protein MshO
MNNRAYGFTLLEAVVVIAITGIVAAIVAVFIRAPVQGYFDSANRAELTDVADTALRRISRDLHLALPNSVRVTGSNHVMEFLSTRDGGRYRSDVGTGGAGDILDFTQNDTSFDILGPPITFATTDYIVVYNLGIPGADAYESNTVRRAYNGTAGAQSNVSITSATPFPFDSPSHRFQVVDTPVTYLCDLTAGTLTRYSGYTIVSTQPNPPTGGSLVAALLAKNLTACDFSYTAGVTQRSALVSIRLSVTQSNETVSLYHEVHVNNVP